MMIFGRKMAKDLLYHVPPSGGAKTAVFDARMVGPWGAYGAPKAKFFRLKEMDEDEATVGSWTSSWALSSTSTRCQKVGVITLVLQSVVTNL